MSTWVSLTDLSIVIMAGIAKAPVLPQLFSPWEIKFYSLLEMISGIALHWNKDGCSHLRGRPTRFLISLSWRHSTVSPESGSRLSQSQRIRDFHVWILDWRSLTKILPLTAFIPVTSYPFSSSDNIGTATIGCLCSSCLKSCSNTGGFWIKV